MRIKWNRHLDVGAASHRPEEGEKEEEKKRGIFRIFRRKKSRRHEDVAGTLEEANEDEEDCASVSSVATCASHPPPPSDENFSRDRASSLFSSFRLSLPGSKRKKRRVAPEAPSNGDRYSTPDLRKGDGLGDRGGSLSTSSPSIRHPSAAVSEKSLEARSASTLNDRSASSSSPRPRKGVLSSSSPKLSKSASSSSCSPKLSKNASASDSSPKLSKSASTSSSKLSKSASSSSSSPKLSKSASSSSHSPKLSKSASSSSSLKLSKSASSSSSPKLSKSAFASNPKLSKSAFASNPKLSKSVSFSDCGESSRGVAANEENSGAVEGERALSSENREDSFSDSAILHKRPGDEMTKTQSNESGVSENILECRLAIGNLDGDFANDRCGYVDSSDVTEVPLRSSDGKVDVPSPKWSVSTNLHSPYEIKNPEQELLDVAYGIRHVISCDIASDDVNHTCDVARYEKGDSETVIKSDTFSSEQPDVISGSTHVICHMKKIYESESSIDRISVDQQLDPLKINQLQLDLGIPVDQPEDFSSNDSCTDVNPTYKKNTVNGGSATSDVGGHIPFVPLNADALMNGSGATGNCDQKVPEASVLQSPGSPNDQRVPGFEMSLLEFEEVCSRYMSHSTPDFSECSVPFPVYRSLPKRKSVLEASLVYANLSPSGIFNNSMSNIHPLLSSEERGKQPGDVDQSPGEPGYISDAGRTSSPPKQWPNSSNHREKSFGVQRTEEARGKYVCQGLGACSPVTLAAPSADTPQQRITTTVLGGRSDGERGPALDDSAEVEEDMASSSSVGHVRNISKTDGRSLEAKSSLFLDCDPLHYRSLAAEAYLEDFCSGYYETGRIEIANPYREESSFVLPRNFLLGPPPKEIGNLEDSEDKKCVGESKLFRKDAKSVNTTYEPTTGNGESRLVVVNGKQSNESAREQSLHAHKPKNSMIPCRKRGSLDIERTKRTDTKSSSDIPRLVKGECLPPSKAHRLRDADGTVGNTSVTHPRPGVATAAANSRNVPECSSARVPDILEYAYTANENNQEYADSVVASDSHLKFESCSDIVIANGTNPGEDCDSVEGRSRTERDEECPRRASLPCRSSLASSRESLNSQLTSSSHRGKSRIPKKQAPSRVGPAGRPGGPVVRPPAWLSKAELGAEIQRLGTLCEARTKELNRLKMETRHVTSGFDAFAALFRYTVEELHALSVPALSEDLSKTLRQLELAKQDIAYFEREAEEMKSHHCQELNDLSNRLFEVYQSEVAELNAKHQEEINRLKSDHQKQMELLQSTYDGTSAESKARHEKRIASLEQEIVHQREELQQLHEREIRDLERRQAEGERLLREQVEQLQGKCAELEQRSAAMEEALRRDTDSKLQWVTSAKLDLEKEVESLKAVLEMKNKELHALRVNSLEAEKQLEELPLAREKIKMLQARAEDLEALMAEKTRTERQLESENRAMRDTFERESKVNRRLSMENEELLWRLRQAENSLLSGSFAEGTVPECPETEEEDGALSPTKSPQTTLSRSVFFTFADEGGGPSSPRFKKITPAFAAGYKTSPARAKSHSEPPPPPSSSSTPRKVARQVAKAAKRQRQRSGGSSAENQNRQPSSAELHSMASSCDSATLEHQNRLLAEENLKRLPSSAEHSMTSSCDSAMLEHQNRLLEKHRGHIAHSLEVLRSADDLCKGWCSDDIPGDARLPNDSDQMSRSAELFADPKTYYHMTFDHVTPRESSDAEDKNSFGHSPSKDSTHSMSENDICSGVAAARRADDNKTDSDRWRTI